MLAQWSNPYFPRREKSREDVIPAQAGLQPVSFLRKQESRTRMCHSCVSRNPGAPWVRPLVSFLRKQESRTRMCHSRSSIRVSFLRKQESRGPLGPFPGVIPA